MTRPVRSDRISGCAATLLSGKHWKQDERWARGNTQSLFELSLQRTEQAKQVASREDGGSPANFEAVIPSSKFHDRASCSMTGRTQWDGLTGCLEEPRGPLANSLP